MPKIGAFEILTDQIGVKNPSFIVPLPGCPDARHNHCKEKVTAVIGPSVACDQISLPSLCIYKSKSWRMFVKYFIPEDGDEQAHPNVFRLDSTQPSFSEIKSVSRSRMRFLAMHAFDLHVLNLSHRRFRCRAVITSGF